MENPVPVAMKCPQCGGNLNPGGEAYTVCQYCGSSLVWNRAASGRSESAVRGIRLKRFACQDAQGTGLEVFRMLVPAGWQVQGGCQWLLDNPGMPAIVHFVAWNPQGGEAFEVLPNMNFIWSNAAMTQRGGRHFGAEVQPPARMEEAFLGYVLPRYRGSVENLQLVRMEPQPDLPRLVKSDAPVTPGGSAEGGKLRIHYRYQNWEFEEEMYGVVEIFRAQIASMFGPTDLFVWFIDYLFSFRAAAGRLDATADLFTVMIQSFRLNPNWYAAFKTVAQQMAQQQIQRIQHIGQIGSMLAQAGSQMREQNLNDWYARQATYDRLATDRSRAIRDVEGFFDPHRQEVVELPAGYGHAWANNLGEVILTEDPNFNPNQESTQHWEPMQPTAP